MPFSRRDFLKRAAPLSLVPLLPGCESQHVPPPSPSPGTVFLHGVASGDPLPDAVILWTRVTPADGAADTLSVRYVIATDAKLSHVVQQGELTTSAAVDYTLKLDAQRLDPGKTYYYQFSALGESSPVGRTRTLPSGAVAQLRLAVCSCSNYPYGFFNAYRLIAERADLDLVLHLGDYLYEYANGQFGDGTALGREPDPAHEIITLEDYRLRHAQYKTDPDLQEAHRQHPFVTVWDDHETANNSYRDGAQNHQPATEGEWQLRKASAIQAYREWMPIRDTPDGFERIYRSFALGDLADLIMLDTRLAGRDAQVADPCDAAAIADPARSLLGADQQAWFFGELQASQARSARWRLLGQQVRFGQIENMMSQPVCPRGTDSWDGYGAARAQVFGFLEQNAIDNVVILTGDVHSSWALDITPDPFDPALYDGVTGSGSRGVELITPGVTSPSIEDPEQAAAYAESIRATHPHIKYAELNRRGYLLLDVTHERVHAEWYHLQTVSEPSTAEELAAAFDVWAGDNHLSLPEA